MSNNDKQRKSECEGFNCQHINRCVAFLGKTCTRQGGEKIPTQRVIPQQAKMVVDDQGVGAQRVNDRPTNARVVDRPYPRTQMRPYFMCDGWELSEGR